MQASSPTCSPESAGALVIGTHSFDRRTLLTGAAAALTVPLLPPGFVHAAVPPVRRRVGSVDVTVISDGTLTVPLSMTLPDTPPTETAALLTAHGLPVGGAPTPTNVSLIASGNELVLIDAGSGANFQPTAGKLAENMEAAGLDPAKITKIVFTHGHADHLWGALDDFDDDVRFPNASYVISAAEWDFWTDPGTPARVPDWLKGMARGSARILKRLEPKIERRKNGDTIAAGISLIETAGHTPGHMSVLVESEREMLLIGADALTHVAVSFARPDWRWGTDEDSDRAVTTRKRLLDRLATERTALIGFHLPWPGIGMVERSGAAYRFVPAD
jgi:glyoxylase-like metal-dependent hydrolase (beta-lactamase superfamily II)